MIILCCFTSGERKAVSERESLALINDFETNSKIVGFVSDAGEELSELDSLLDAKAIKLYYGDDL